MWQLRTGNLELIFIKKAVLSSRFSVLSNGLAENLMYIEFHARSAFSFLEGASLPESLIETCANLGMPAMALLDRDGVYGAPRSHMAAKRAGLKAHIGTEVTTDFSSRRHGDTEKNEKLIQGRKVGIRVAQYNQDSNFSVPLCLRGGFR